ncbi:hypothetical protein F511_37316 [Dorcoceras hygrometricum]|uniref:Uncharacterized protein n=1 Tax=Dorcoceras hygrometricum TaxID=472368 RepID=A0A2Z7CB47_9LAMI|nr:hypothetical protein F511_37316 [Dorcoceras hygrometricum]
MASSLISNSHHIDYDSVFDMDDAGLAQVCETLIATGLRNFLGCPAVFYEEALLEFFANGTVRDGLVVSTVHGVTVEISEHLFAEMFELPVEGLTDLTDVPKDKIFYARSLFSASKEQVSVSCFKKEMKIEYRLLHDILAKTLFVKAGSFDAAGEGFCNTNWCSFAECAGIGGRESKGFPKSRILDAKTGHRFVHINEKVGLDESAASPRVKKTPVNKAVSKKRQVGAGEEALVMKKKRTTKGKPVVIAQEVVPLQTVEATTDAPVEQLSVPKRKSQKRKRKLILEDAIEVDAPVPASVEQPAVVPVVEGTTEDPDTVINQVLNQLDSISGDKDGKQSDREETWFDRAFDEMLRNDSPVVTPSDTDEEEETIDVGAAGLQNTLGHQNDYFRNLIQSARQEGQNQDDLQILRLNELRKTVIAQGFTADTDSLAVRNRFNALDAKILLLDGQVATIRSEQLEFQEKMAADLLSLSTQIGDLVDYIRGGDAKKGEGSNSRRPLPTPVNQGESSGNVIRTTEIISQTDIGAAQRDLMERMMRADRERDRERRERRLSISGSYKRKRGY